MKKLTVLIAGLLILVPALAFSDSISLRGGYFMPRATTSSYLAAHPNSLWAIEFDQMSFPIEKYRGTMLGFSYEYFVGNNLSLAFTLDSYSKNRPGYYIDYLQNTLEEGDFAFPYEDFYGDYIQHAFSVSSTPLQVSLKFTPLGRKTRLIPFFGGGAGLYFYSVRIYGQTVNFGDRSWFYDFETETAYSNPDDPNLRDQQIYPVEGVNGREKGSVFGYHAFAGVQFPIGYRATIEAEARYHWAKVMFGEWFLDFEEFDLGGLALTIGINYWF